VRIAVLIVLVLASSARADDKDPDTALALSIGATAVAAGVTVGGVLCYPNVDSHASCNALLVAGAAGLLFAPSLGHWYAGRIAPPGLWMRGAGGTAGVLGVGMIAVAVLSEGSTGSLGLAGGALALSGAGLFVCGIVEDLVEARRAATRYNDAHRVHVMPTVLHPPSGPVMGIGISARF